MKRKLFFGLLSFMVFIAILFIGCAQPPTSPTSTPTPGATTASTKTLKIGALYNLSTARGLDMQHCHELLVALDNQNGGWSVGGEKYKIEVITYDTGATQDTEVTAANKMIYQDNVKFIIEGGGTGSPALPAITEPNKVLLFTPSMVLPGWSPSWNYVYDGAGTSAQNAVIVGWLIKNYPDAMKNSLLAYSDDPPGNQLTTMFKGLYSAFGLTPSTLSFPASAQDLSSLGTKVASMNPGIVYPVTIDPSKLGLACNAMRDAGYKGLFFAASINPAANLAKVMNPSALEGFLNGAYPTEFTPPLDQTAKEFMDAWIAKYGSWTSPGLTSIPNYYCIRAAVQQAGSVDPDKVAATLNNGMKYPTPLGPAQMVNRMDIGISRTVNSVYAVYMKAIKNGQATLIGTIGVDEGLGYLQSSLKAQSKK